MRIRSDGPNRPCLAVAVTQMSSECANVEGVLAMGFTDGKPKRNVNFAQPNRSGRSDDVRRLNYTFLIASFSQAVCREVQR